MDASTTKPITAMRYGELAAQVEAQSQQIAALQQRDAERERQVRELVGFLHAKLILPFKTAAKILGDAGGQP